MEKLFLSGMKHSGKTTVMKALSERLGIRGIDSDDMLAERFCPLSVREWYRTYGKERFMEEEYRAVSAWCRSYAEPFIMSLGGGAADNAPLMEALPREGRLVYLRRREEDMLPIILKDGLPPFLDEEDPRGSFHALYERRDGIYGEKADIIIDLGPYGDRDKDLMTVIKELQI